MSAESHDQIRKDEIFALSEIFSDTCQKEPEADDVLTFYIEDADFNNKKIKFQVRFIGLYISLIIPFLVLIIFFFFKFIKIQKIDSYPLVNKPDYLIIADWLPSDLEKILKEKLNEIWNENLNQPIVYLWIESIKENVLKWFEENKKDKSKEIVKNFHELNISNFKEKGFELNLKLIFDHLIKLESIPF